MKNIHSHSRPVISVSKLRYREDSAATDRLRPQLLGIHSCCSAFVSRKTRLVFFGSQNTYKCICALDQNVGTRLLFQAACESDVWLNCTSRSEKLTKESQLIFVELTSFGQRRLDFNKLFVLLRLH